MKWKSNNTYNVATSSLVSSYSSLPPFQVPESQNPLPVAERVHPITTHSKCWVHEMIVSYIVHSILMFLLVADEIWNWVWIVLLIVLNYDFNLSELYWNCIGQTNRLVVLYCYCIARILITDYCIGIVLVSKRLYWSTLLIIQPSTPS